MKTRNGFVSNSSTSSFIVIGVEMKENDFNFKEEDIETTGIPELLEKRKIGYRCDYENDTYYIGKGKYIGEYSIDSMPLPTNEDLEKIVKDINSVRQSPVSISDVRIHSGVIAS